MRSEQRLSVSHIFLIAFLVLIVTAAVTTFFRLQTEEKTVRWDMINVNQTIQGDAHLIRGPKGTVLMDTGHPREYKRSLLPFLVKESVTHIDALIITHPHIDHYGGLVQLITNKEIAIGKIYLTDPSEELAKSEYGWGVDPEHLSTIRKEAKLREIPVVPVQEFDIFDFGSGYHLKKLHSPTEEDLKSNQLNQDINDLSLITMLTNRSIKILFTGDLNTSYSEHLLKTNNPAIYEADILKFPHHGMEGFASDLFIKNTKAKHFFTPMPSVYLQNPRADRFFRLAREMGTTTYINGNQGDISVYLSEQSYYITYNK